MILLFHLIETIESIQSQYFAMKPGIRTPGELDTVGCSMSSTDQNQMVVEDDGHCR